MGRLRSTSLGGIDLPRQSLLLGSLRLRGNDTVTKRLSRGAWTLLGSRRRQRLHPSKFKFV